MEIKTRDIILGMFGALGVYYVYNKFIKKAVPKDNSIKPQPIADGTINPYPVGEVLSSNQTGNVDTGTQVQLKEGDAIKGIPETIYVLKDGKKHPVSGAWWIYHYGENFNGTFIQLSDFTVSLIPTGDTFTINGQ